MIRAFQWYDRVMNQLLSTFICMFVFSLTAFTSEAKEIELSEIPQLLKNGHTYVSRTSVDGADHSCQNLSFLMDQSEPSQLLYVPEGDVKLGEYPECQVAALNSKKYLSLMSEEILFAEKASRHRMFNLEKRVVEVGGMEMAEIQKAEYSEKDKTLTLTIFLMLTFSENTYRIDLSSATDFRTQ